MMNTCDIEQINNIIISSSKYRNIDWSNFINTDDISDWYHTFWELYKHRTHLFIALCKMFINLWESKNLSYVSKSKKHNDWFDVWNKWWMFIVQLETSEWQISYHIPNEYWDKCDFIPYLPKAKEWDWHTSDDVLYRLLLI